jgi:hypothetical protein
MDGITNGITLFGKWIGWIIELMVEIELVEWLKFFDTFKMPPKTGYASRIAKTYD